MSDMRNILVLDLNHIGDVLFTTPAIRAIRDRYPSSRIVGVVSSGVADALRHNPNIDRLILRRTRSLLETLRIGLGLRSERFDMSFCFSFSSFRLAAIGRLAGAKERIGFNTPQVRSFLTRVVPNEGGKHQAESYLDLVRATGHVTSDYPMELFVSDEDSRFADEFLADAGCAPGQPLVGVNPGGTVRVNQWFPDRFAALSDRLQQDGARVVIFGGRSEKYLAQKIANAMRTAPILAAGKTRIGQSAGLISRCKAFVSGDTGPLHMAVSLRIPTVAIFGPADPERTGPYMSRGVILWERLSCAPCWRKPTCVFRECLDLITVETVYEATQRAMSEAAPVSQPAAR